MRKLVHRTRNQNIIAYIKNKMIQLLNILTVPNTG